MWDILDLCGGDKGWVVYHNNQRLRHHKVLVHHGDFFACYERNDSNTPFQADRIGYDAAMERVANTPAPVHSEAAEPTVSVPDANDDAGHEDTAAFEQTGNPLFLIGRGSGRRNQGNTAEALYLSPWPVACALLAWCSSGQKKNRAFFGVSVPYVAGVACSCAVSYIWFSPGLHILIHPPVRVPLDPHISGSGIGRATVGLPYASVSFRDY